ncbi:Uncharacterised protein [Bordetella pertussis]|nr:Uncharacterised protein [Bordetella pertussis]
MASDSSRPTPPVTNWTLPCCCTAGSAPCACTAPPSAMLPAASAAAIHARS